LETTLLGGFEIPKGARVFVSFYLIHRHQDFWPQPAQFKPERFLSKDPEAFMPFGLGQRYCLGKNLAMLQGPLVLAHLSKQLRLALSTEADISPKVVISLFAKYGIPMKVLDSQ
jgi:cytochrome P450